MRQSRPSIICAVIASVLAVPAAAQNPQCDALAFPSARPACNTAVDAIRAFHPLAGMIVSGGNPVLGTAGSLGGIGHLTVTARVNAIKASLPNPDSASQSQVPSSFHGAIPAPVVEGALGLLRGRGGFLSVDALGSAVCMPIRTRTLLAPGHSCAASARCAAIAAFAAPSARGNAKRNESPWLSTSSPP